MMFAGRRSAQTAGRAGTDEIAGVADVVAEQIHRAADFLERGVLGAGEELAELAFQPT